MLNNDEGTVEGYTGEGSDPTIYEETKKGDFYYWTPPDLEKPRNLTPSEKLATEAHLEFVADKAVQRQHKCWEVGCARDAYVWVLEVQFDMKGDKADAGQHAIVNTQDYDGPVPGFCPTHLGGGPAHLAEQVYFSAPLMQWGFKPRRWFVIFTDGTKQGGSCLEIDPKQETPTIIEEFNAS